MRPKDREQTQPQTIERTFGDNLVEMVGSLTTSSSTNAILELIVNGYDADATEMYVHYDSLESKLTISDNGTGMNKEEIKAFYRLGDSPKLVETFSPAGRRRIGKFGVATIVLKLLAEKYFLTTSKDGIEISLEESFEGELRQDKKIPYHTSRVAPSKHGTSIELKGLKFKEGEGFSLKDLRRKIQWGLPLLPDFKVYVNGKEVEPKAIKDAITFNFDSVGEQMGPIKATIYHTSTKTPMAGIHVYVNGRQVGNPKEMIDFMGIKMSLGDRVVGIVHADKLEPAILFDRGRFNEDNHGYAELKQYILRCVKQIASHVDSRSEVYKIRILEQERKRVIGGVLSRLSSSGLEEITKSITIEFSEQIPEVIPSIYNSSSEIILLNSKHPILKITDQSTVASYAANVLHTIVDGIALSKAEENGKVDSGKYLAEKTRIWGVLNQVRKGIREKDDIHPRIVYSPPELAVITGTSLGAIRYQINGGILPAIGEEGGILGQTVLDAQKKIRGKVSLYEFAQKKDSSQNMFAYLNKYSDLFAEAGDAILPFVENLGAKDAPCFFIDADCVKTIAEILNTHTVDKRNNCYNPSRAFREAGDAYYSLPTLSEKLGWGDIPRTAAILDYAKRNKLTMGQLHGNGVTFKYADVIKAKQHMAQNSRGN